MGIDDGRALLRAWRFFSASLPNAAGEIPSTFASTGEKCEPRETEPHQSNDIPSTSSLKTTPCTVTAMGEAQHLESRSCRCRDIQKPRPTTIY